MRKALFIVVLTGYLALAQGLVLNDSVIKLGKGQYGEQAAVRVANWRDLMSAKAGDEKDKLNRVNRFFNKVPYLSDLQIWQKKDYWASPVEMLGVNKADCEDYSIAKYFTLTEMGVDPEKLRITYVKAVKLKEAHMVLSYYETPDSIPLILDNLRNDIVPANQRKDLVPVYSFNGDSIWTAVDRGKGKRVGSAGRIKMWADLQEKMQSEGK